MAGVPSKEELGYVLKCFQRDFPELRIGQIFINAAAWNQSDCSGVPHDAALFYLEDSKLIKALHGYFYHLWKEKINETKELP
ncbi:MAG: hypothetical protein ACYSTI_12710 [Planctomycetota bacterium]|jgi:hypothetical protein